MLRGLLDDISKDEAPRSYNVTSLQRTQPLRKAATPVRPFVPPLLCLPPEIRKCIYDFLPETTITFHSHRLIGAPNLPVSYTTVPPSAGHVYQRIRLPAASPCEDHEWDTYSVLANGSYGLTLTHRLFRQEILTLVLENATFVCDDDEALGLFTTIFPKFWRPHLKNFSGWIQNGVPAIPTDPGRFPNLRKVELNMPVPVFENWPGRAVLLEEFKKIDARDLRDFVLAPPQAVAEKEHTGSVINAFTLMDLMPSIEFVVRRDCLVCFREEEPLDGAVGEEWNAGVRKRQFGWFELEYNSSTEKRRGKRTGRVTRRFKRGWSKSTFQKGGVIPEEDVKERWIIEQ